MDELIVSRQIHESLTPKYYFYLYRCWSVWMQNKDCHFGFDSLLEIFFVSGSIKPAKDYKKLLENERILNKNKLCENLQGYKVEES